MNWERRTSPLRAEYCALVDGQGTVIGCIHHFEDELWHVTGQRKGFVSLRDAQAECVRVHAHTIAANIPEVPRGTKPRRWWHSLFTGRKTTDEHRLGDGRQLTPVPGSGGFKLMPPPADCCQECAVKHDPTWPHNAQSFYYQFKFNALHGRSANWKDAMEHCTPEMKAFWTEELKKEGVDVDGGQVNPPRTTNH